MEAKYNIQAIINYLEATKPEQWITDVVRDKRGNGCFFSHLFDFGGGDNGGSALWDWFEEVWATTYMIYPVNDGEHPKYKQATPRERIIAYLKDLRDGKEKNTRILWDETANLIRSPNEAEASHN